MRVCVRVCVRPPDCVIPKPIPKPSHSFTNAGLLSQSRAFDKIFLDQTVALLSLPPLADFEEILLRRLRDTANAVSIFQTELVGGP